MALKNPFTPSFGKVPAVLAGRDLLLDDMTSAFEQGSGDPNLSTILMGARGTGKTALMTSIACGVLPSMGALTTWLPSAASSWLEQSWIIACLRRLARSSPVATCVFFDRDAAGGRRVCAR